MSAVPVLPGTSAVRIAVRGAVQGTGFRPFVYRVARQLGLTGSIRNTPFGVLIHVEGPQPALDDFHRRLGAEAPPAANLRGVEVAADEVLGSAVFTIEDSDTTGELSVAVLPDLATCGDCVRELFDPADRRHGYPFLNCTACGPRLSIIEGLPYDRPRTAMKGFTLCARCAQEYHDPGDRRFHAQPVACPACGPALAFAEPGTRPPTATRSTPPWRRSEPGASSRSRGSAATSSSRTPAAARQWRGSAPARAARRSRSR